jgi:hypothetical protein
MLDLFYDKRNITAAEGEGVTLDATDALASVALAHKADCGDFGIEFPVVKMDGQKPFGVCVGEDEATEAEFQGTGRTDVCALVSALVELQGTLSPNTLCTAVPSTGVVQAGGPYHEG